MLLGLYNKVRIYHWLRVTREIYLRCLMTTTPAATTKTKGWWWRTQASHKTDGLGVASCDVSILSETFTNIPNDHRWFWGFAHVGKISALTSFTIPVALSCLYIVPLIIKNPLWSGHDSPQLVLHCYSRRRPYAKRPYQHDFLAAKYPNSIKLVIDLEPLMVW